ncbi:MAG TPA: hypothetical protein VM347_30525 [Nonomuraea sp.]|nr:hypothetical protein [Nonomuraea sp.]
MLHRRRDFDQGPLLGQDRSSLVKHDMALDRLSLGKRPERQGGQEETRHDQAGASPDASPRDHP